MEILFPGSLRERNQRCCISGEFPVKKDIMHMQSVSGIRKEGIWAF